MEMKMRYIVIILAVLTMSSCQCKIIWTNEVFAGGCSLCAETTLADVVIEPNSVRLGSYAADTDDLKVNTVYGDLETK